MDARPLRELLADLVGDAEARHAYGSDPAGYLAAHGHPGLPEPLVAEAVVSYADTAPVEVAEVLAPYVMANGPVPGDEQQAEWFDLLTSAEVGDNPFDESLAAPEPAEDWADPAELDFGAGSGADVVAEPALVAETELVETAAETVAETPVAEPGWTAEAFGPEQPIAGLEPEADDEPLD